MSQPVLASASPAPKNLARAFAKNAFFKAAGEIIMRGLAFAFMVLVARRLGNADFGVLNFANSFALLFVVIVDFGLNPLLVRDLAREPGRGSHYFYNFLGIKIFLGLLFLGAVGLGMPWAASDTVARQTVIAFAFFILFNSFTEFMNAVFNAHQKMQYEAGIMTFQKIALLVLGLTALFLGWGVRGVAAAYAMAGLLGMIIAAVCLRHTRFLAGAWHWDLASVRYGLRQALPLTLTTLFINLYFRIDMTILAKLRPAAEVGWYGAAHKCIEVLMVVPAVLVVASFPGFSKLFIEDQPRLSRAFRKVMRLLLLLAAPLAAGVWMVGEPLMAWVFGQAFAPAGLALAWLCVALGFIFLNYPLSFLLISAGRQTINAMVAGLAVVVSVTANLLLVPHFGFLGAAAAAAITEGFLFIAYWLAVRRTVFPVALLDPSLRVLAAVGVMQAGLWWCRSWHPLAVITIGGALYAAALLVFRVPQPEDFELLRKIFKRGSTHA